ncbi:MAG: endolytic transglycosylase MltG [Bacteroidales bacterium]|nr:endolytic transglycosylase MltG [Bacteroidales bacterium]
MKSKRLIVRIVVVVALLALIKSYLIFLQPISTEKFSVYIKPTSTYADVKSQIDIHANFSSRIFFSAFSTFLGYENNLHVGKYEAKKGTSVWSLFTKMYRGRQTPVRLTFNNIRTKEQLAGRFGDQLMLDSMTLLNAFSNEDSCARWGFTTATIPALFIPDTYEMYWNISYEKFMTKMSQAYQDFWTNDRKVKAEEVGLTPIEISIMASIVEEESNSKAERPAIAGLYLNRYRIGMPLQADPTVKFAVNDFSLRRILFEHLKVDSPYNTYKNIGLPPGPIRVPSAEGIDAVLNYQKHDYLYMCAKYDFSGQHAFARTMEEHHRNAQKYREELNKRKIQ